MNKTKSMITGFAVFAAFLMLMATCIARPVQEKTSIEAVDNGPQELIDSVEAMCLKIENDQEWINLIEQLSNDRTLERIASSIENTDDVDVKSSLTANYVDVLVDKQEFSDLQSYFENSYSADMQDIDDELVELLETLSEGQNTDILDIESEEFEIVGFLPFDNAIPVGLPDDDDLELTGVAQDLTISSSGDIILMSEEIDLINNNDGDSPIDLDSGEALYAGFLFNLDGGMLVPGYGWVYPDDPNWDDWLDLHNSLQGMPVSYATAVLDRVAEMFGDGLPTGIIIDLIIEIILEIIRIITDMVNAIIDLLINQLVDIAAGILAAIVVTILAAILAFLTVYVTIVDILAAILEWLQGIN